MLDLCMSLTHLACSCLELPCWLNEGTWCNLRYTDLDATRLQFSVFLIPVLVPVSLLLTWSSHVLLDQCKKATLKLCWLQGDNCVPHTATQLEAKTGSVRRGPSRTWTTRDRCLPDTSTFSNATSGSSRCAFCTLRLFLWTLQLMEAMPLLSLLSLQNFSKGVISISWWYLSQSGKVNSDPQSQVHLMYPYESYEGILP